MTEYGKGTNFDFGEEFVLLKIDGRYILVMITAETHLGIGLEINIVPLSNG